MKCVIRLVFECIMGYQISECPARPYNGGPIPRVRNGRIIQTNLPYLSPPASPYSIAEIVLILFLQAKQKSTNLKLVHVFRILIFSLLRTGDTLGFQSSLPVFQRSFNFFRLLDFWIFFSFRARNMLNLFLRLPPKFFRLLVRFQILSICNFLAPLVVVSHIPSESFQQIFQKIVTISG